MDDVRLFFEATHSCSKIVDVTTTPTTTRQGDDNDAGTNSPLLAPTTSSSSRSNGCRSRESVQGLQAATSSSSPACSIAKPTSPRQRTLQKRRRRRQLSTAQVGGGKLVVRATTKDFSMIICFLLLCQCPTSPFFVLRVHGWSPGKVYVVGYNTRVSGHCSSCHWRRKKIVGATTTSLSLPSLRCSTLLLRALAEGGGQIDGDLMYGTPRRLQLSAPSPRPQTSGRRNDKRSTNSYNPRNTNRNNNNNYRYRNNNDHAKKTRRDQLRNVIRSIETFGIVNGTNIVSTTATTASTSHQQQQPNLRPCPPLLLSILRSLYQARNSKEVTEAGKKLEELLIVVPLRPSERATPAAAKTTMTSDIWKDHTCRDVQERIIKACALAGLLHLATTLLRHQLQDDDEEEAMPNYISYISVCESLKRVGRCDQLESVLGDLSTAAKKRNKTMNLVAFNVYLACLCQENERNDEHGLQAPSARSRQAKVIKAWNWIRPLDNSTTTATLAEQTFAIPSLDVTSYNTVLNGASTLGNRTMANAIWNEMKRLSSSSSSSFDLDIQSYNIRLRSFGNDKPKSMLRFFDEEILNQPAASSSDGFDVRGASTTSIQPDSYTIDLMLLPLIGAGMMDDVKKMMDSFIGRYSEQVVSNSFSAFLATLIQQGGDNVHAARDLFDSYVLPTIEWRTKYRLQKEEEEQEKVATSEIASASDKSLSSRMYLVRPTTRQFNILIEGYRRLAELYETKQQSISNKETEFKSPSVVNTDQDEKPDEAEEKIADPDIARWEGWTLYRLMVDEAGLTPDAYTITSVVGICATSDELTNFLESQRGDDTEDLECMKMPAVLRAAIARYGQLGDPSKSCLLYDRYGGMGYKTNDVRMWNVLLGALSEGAKRDDMRLSLDPTRYLDDAARTPSSQESDSARDQSQDDSIVTLIDGKTCTEAVEILLDQMRTKSSSRAPSPNSQSYCIVASALQHAPGMDPSVAWELFRNATGVDGISADGRFANAILRCFGGDIDAALQAFSKEIRPACLAYEQRPRNIPPPLNRRNAKNLVAAYNGLLYVCGRAVRPDIALRVVYAMNRENIEPNDVSLNCYQAGKRQRKLNEQSKTQQIPESTADNNFEQQASSKDNSRLSLGRLTSKLKQKVVPKFKILPNLGLVDQYENLLYVECTKYDRNDKRRESDKRVRIIV